ncbi:hypothetical protein SNEBB_010982 [Seison nebaliae]|nr:hypothetical protein SNEBB_010982 [Seison nebaliae]
MGWSRRRRKNRKENTHQKNDDRDVRGQWESFEKKNEIFEFYYKNQNICKNDEEWKEFVEILSKPLPSAFRVVSSGNDKEKVVELIREIYKLGDDQAKIKRIAWSPTDYLFEMDCGRQEIRKTENFREFHQFITTMDQSGRISRQESVSMIPPFLLDIRSHHRVLDMCAAPGSKTAQLIEFLLTNDGNGDGFLVANDVDNRRCYMLSHQMKRLNSHQILITNQDASSIPNFRESSNSKKTTMKFNRILCDVPCSGDGTIRKNVDIWRKWSFLNAIHLHGIQSRILRRAIQLLSEEDGRIVYSTCSLCPIENEAVISNVLEDFHETFELVDIRTILPKLKCSPGLTKWTILNPSLKNGDEFSEENLWKTYDDVSKSQQTTIKEYMFPSKNIHNFHMERCARICPHYQNSGGFFVAILQRKLISTTTSITLNNHIVDGQLKEEPDNNDDCTKPKQMKTDVNLISTARSISSSLQKKLANGYFKEEPYYFLKDHFGDDFFDKLKNFFGIKDDFPFENLYTRSLQGKNEKLPKIIYFGSNRLLNLVKENGDRFKFINMGCRIFERLMEKECEECQYRICSEALPLVIKYFGQNRIVNICEVEDVTKLLTHPFPLFTSLSDELQKCVSKYSKGSIILQIDNIKNNKQLMICAFIANVSISTFISNTERRALLYLYEVDGIDRIIQQITCAAKEHNGKSLNSNITDEKLEIDVKPLTMVPISTDSDEISNSIKN